MSNKISTIYACTKCGAQSLKWSGRCLECGGWGTLQIQTVDKKEINQDAPPAEIINFADIKSNEIERLKTDIGELDGVLGGGIARGSLILLSGEPGIGKSTIVAQIADRIAGKYKDQSNAVIYISGEETAQQVKSRLERLRCNAARISFITEVNAEKIMSALSRVKPVLVIVDSIQTVYSDDIPSEAGGVAQIKAGAVKFLEIAKKYNIAVILIGHVTKDGVLAGPKSLEHIVDTVVYLESEALHNFRILRAIKNRFGAINELGIFEMTGFGFKEVGNPASIFLEEDKSAKKISGAAISCIFEGTRAFLVEIQALVTKTVFGYPQRKSSGFDLNRLQVLIAVLTKKTKINLTNQDVILNIAGGLKVSDPAVDLAVCLAIASSLLSQTVDRKIIILGEVGLSGEVRSVSKLDQRLAEAEKLGFTKAIGPAGEAQTKKIQFAKIKNLSEIVEWVTKN